MILSSLDPAPSGAHPRGRILPWSLAIVWSVFVAIWLGQHPTGPAATDFCSNFVFNYPRSISEPLGAPACPDKNFWAEEIFGAIWLGLLPTGPAAANFCPNTVLINSWWIFKPPVASVSPDKNFLAESAMPSRLDAICPGRTPTGPPEPEFCTNIVLNYPGSVSKQTDAALSPVKNFSAESARHAFLSAIWLGRPSTGLPTADICSKSVLDFLIAFIGSFIWAWLLCCSNNSGIKQKSNPAAGDNKGLESGHRRPQPHRWLYPLHQTSPKKRIPDLGHLPSANLSIDQASKIKPNPPVTRSTPTSEETKILFPE